MFHTRLSTSVRAAIDLGSIMVGVIVVGIITGIAAVAAFGVIPWSQDQAAVSQLDEVASAQAAQKGVTGMAGATSYGTYQQLVSAELLPDNINGLCVTTAGAGWSAVIKSSTGKYWSTTDKLAAPIEAVKADFTACTTGPETIGTAYADTLADATMELTVNSSLRAEGASGAACTTFTLPIRGTVNATVDWGDGTAVETVTGAGLPAHTYPAAQSFQVKVNGTFTRYGAFATAGNPTSTASTGCVAALSHWGKDTGTTAADGAYAFHPSVDGVSAPPKTVTSLSGAFYYAATFNQPVSTWSTGNVTDMSFMFQGASMFNQPVTFNATKVTDMTGMFFEAKKFNSPVSFTSPALTTAVSMFYGATVFNSPVSIDTSRVTDMQYMFTDAKAFNQPVNFDTGLVQQMGFMFQGATAFNQPVAFDTKNVADMKSMFFRATAFNQPISFNSPKLKNTVYMFGFAPAFNSPVTMNTSAVTDMSNMFYGANTFNQPLAFNTGEVRNMNYMFFNAFAFNQDISAWNVTKVTSYVGFSTNTALTPVLEPVWVS